MTFRMNNTSTFATGQPSLILKDCFHTGVFYL